MRERKLDIAKAGKSLKEVAGVLIAIGIAVSDAGEAGEAGEDEIESIVLRAVYIYTSSSLSESNMACTYDRCRK